MKILGIDVGTHSIKVAEIDAATKSYSLTNFLEYPLSADPAKDRSLEIIDRLRTLTALYDPNNTRFVIGVPQHRVSLHHRRFPFRERQKIYKSLAFELEDEIPLDVDETIFEAKIVEYAGVSADVLTIACPKDVVAEALTLAKDGGFDPEIISVEGLAFANTFEAWNIAPPETSPSAPFNTDAESATPSLMTAPQSGRIVLNIGHSRTLLLVYRGSSLVAVRSILWGGADIAEAIGRVFSVPIYEAVKVLQTKSFILINTIGASRDQLLMSKTVSESVDNLVHDLRLTMLEVKAAFALELTQIEIFGGVSQIQNLPAYLTQALEIPTNHGHHLSHHKSIKFETTAHIEAVSTVAIGLAIEGMRRPRNPAVNLRKGEFARENVTFKRFWEQWRTIVQISAAALVIVMAYSIVRDTLATSLVDAVNSRVSDVAGKIAGLKGAQANASGVERYIKRQKTAIKNRETLMELDSYNSSMDILARLAEKLPVTIPPVPGKGLNVHRLVIDNEDVTIEGRADGPGLITAIEAALTEIAKPKTLAKAQPTSVLEGPGAPFAYKIKVNRKP